jgi:hypothetical protein
MRAVGTGRPWNLWLGFLLFGMLEPVLYNGLANLVSTASDRGLSFFVFLGVTVGVASLLWSLGPRGRMAAAGFLTGYAVMYIATSGECTLGPVPWKKPDGLASAIEGAVVYVVLVVLGAVAVIFLPDRRGSAR